jgi:hypothetical protein
MKLLNVSITDFFLSISDKAVWELSSTAKLNCEVMNWWRLFLTWRRSTSSLIDLNTSKSKFCSLYLSCLFLFQCPKFFLSFWNMFVDSSFFNEFNCCFSLSISFINLCSASCFCFSIVISNSCKYLLRIFYSCSISFSWL